MICNLCPRNCNANRTETEAHGFCQIESTMKVSRIAPHLWEEPCISGTNGCGAVFFSGCTLKCVYCQNYEISRQNNGKFISPAKLAQQLKELESTGVHTIEFVSGSHYADKIVKTLDIYRPNVPIVYNSSGYESIDTLKMLEGYIDVYLPDFKYSDDNLAQMLSKAPDYRTVAINAISEMIRQVGKPETDEKGIITKGVIIRHLILPSYTKNSTGVLDLIKENFGDNVLVSLMGQYTPYAESIKFAQLNRKITPREYNKVLNHLINLSLDGFAQELSSADKSYIPKWDY